MSKGETQASRRKRLNFVRRRRKSIASLPLSVYTVALALSIP